ncbi:ubiquitin interaction domain-containing protein [Colletotrichum graminicola M1.001]|uniref:Ubiquitin interaction domain-containing protein n=1 Tax=Colletotrichum graminicola (strain M1.001 / M2 / FGSC 10212) TaxID=645133 RepID=E3QCS2_COLGM|nr:ubiquitin interaction domain-containing protein [Colletotrichum graminicola M1.001]EFQ28660.1 ubiquitin interaction domain-containing protein [Colletotrichum graminicola M1.001]
MSMASNRERARSSSPGPDDDPDLALAIALSLQEQENPKIGGMTTTSSTERPSEQTPKSAPATNFGSLVLDRKRMEEERLARLKKRSATQAQLDDQHQRPKTQRAEAPKGHRPSSATFGSLEAATAARDVPQLPFPKGAFKRTWALGYPRTGEDIKIEEILQKDKLQLAVLSSFQWDEEWLLSKVDVRQTRLLLVAYANNEAEKAAIRANAPTGLVRFCFPPMYGGYMHSKLQILKYEGYLRIVIPSGNLVPYDWGETGVLENMVFLIDLPKLESTQQAAPPAETLFGTELRRFLRALGLDEKLVKSLDSYDFTETSRYGFVHSIAGSHANDSWQHTGQSTRGYCGLGSTVRSLGLATEDAVDIDYVASSLGSLNDASLKAIYYACQGDSGMKEYDARKPKPARSKAAKAGLDGSRPVFNEPLQLQRHFRIYFPTEHTVSSSRGGRSSAGTICFQEKWWKSSTFPRELLRDCQSVRSGLLLHTKAIFVQARDGAAWAYMGSANLSESAWGRLVKERDSGAPKLTCRNWECGVLVAVDGNLPGSADTGTRPGVDQDAQGQAPMSKGEGGPAVTVTDSEEKQRHQQLGQDEPRCLEGVFGTTMPIPMKVPAGRYTSDESAASRPWFFMKAD